MNEIVKISFASQVTFTCSQPFLFMGWVTGFHDYRSETNYFNPLLIEGLRTRVG